MESECLFYKKQTSITVSSVVFITGYLATSPSRVSILLLVDTVWEHPRPGSLVRTSSVPRVSSVEHSGLRSQRIMTCQQPIQMNRLRVALC